MVEDKSKQVERFKGWILGIINGIDARMLVDMIKANDIPTLWEYELPPYLNFVRDLVIEHQETILAQLNLESVMEYCKEYRADLAKILIHKKAQEWMGRFLKKIGFMIKHINLEPYEIQMKYEERIQEIIHGREALQSDKIADLISIPEVEMPPEVVEALEQEPPIPTIEKIPYETFSEKDLANALGKDNISDEYDFL